MGKLYLSLESILESNMRLDFEHWKKLMLSFDFDENQEEYEMVVKKYGEKHRGYHNRIHIEDCLQQLDTYAPDQKEMEMALWYHDVIYDPYGKANELKSAEMAQHFLERNNCDSEMTKRIFDLIMVTLHNTPPKTEAAALIMDIDISILGRSATTYQNYTKAIRKEYRLIPFFIYKRKRREILANFLKREKLYYTPTFFELFETQARINIAKEMEALS